MTVGLSIWVRRAVHPTCTKHRPAAGTRGLERSPTDSNETTGATAFPQFTDINSLVIVSGQGRGRTADLPLFRRALAPQATEPLTAGNPS